MELHEDVIHDLLPIYNEGEASPATQALVQAYLASHPDFAAAVKASQARQPAPLAAAPHHAGHAPITRIQSLMRRRSFILGAAIAFTIAPFTFYFQDTQLTWLMLRDAPAQALLYGIAALGSWIGYVAMGRRLR